MPYRKQTLFPALRCQMGEWVYYVTYMKFQDVNDWIKPTEEVHANKRLSEWIQRRLDSKHTEAICKYLINQPERFFNAIVVGVYGGKPSWAPLKVSVPPDVDFEDLSEEQELEFDDSVGLLKFSGEEKLFAIDGQHRVAGIKKAISFSEDLKKQEICALFVGHENTVFGMERTRRLFTTLNKTAKKVQAADIVALDEDDGFAIVTRKLVNEFDLFSRGDVISFGNQVNIPESQKKYLTSVIGLYHLSQDIYPRKPINKPKKSIVKKSRPSDSEIENLYKMNIDYWSLLVEFIPELRSAILQEATPGEFRESDNNHLLFRAIGQRAFASAVELLISRKNSMKASVKKLSQANLYIHTLDWHNILWDPILEKIILNQVLAETFLLNQVGEAGRSQRNDKRLSEVIKSRQI